MSATTQETERQTEIEAESVAGSPFTLAENRQAWLNEIQNAALVCRQQHDRQIEWEISQHTRQVEFEIAYVEEMRNQRIRFVEQQNLLWNSLYAVVIQQVANTAAAGGGLDSGTVVSIIQQMAKLAQTTPPVTGNGTSATASSTMPGAQPAGSAAEVKV